MGKGGDCPEKCNAGIGHACTLVGVKYEFGVAAPLDEAKAVSFFERGCKLGSAEGCESLARYRFRGRGGPRDDRAALALLEPLCLEGRGSACSLAARVHLARRTADDDERALRLLREGCERGSDEGCRTLASCENQEASACATRARERACELGDVDSCKPRLVN